MKKIMYEESLEYLNPKLAKQWHPTKNGNLTPRDVTSGSHKKVFWKCVKNHSWGATINNRYKGKTNCPLCFKESRSKGYISDDRMLMQEWSYEDNEGIDPKLCAKYSKKKVTWKCKKCNNKWLSTISNRSKGYGCPNCNRGQGKRSNDFVKSYGYLLDEWDYEKNQGIDVNNLSRGSHYLAFWKCKKGHSWQTEVKHRTLNKSNCPYCAGQRAIKNENDLQTINPPFLIEWDYEKNDRLGIQPDMLTEKSKKSVFWKCSRNHSWKETPEHRTKSETMCPFCRGQRTIIGENDLVTLNPVYLDEWDYDKNKYKPENFMLNSCKRVYWKCKNSHSWKIEISHRARGDGCPFCAKQK